MVLGLTMRWLFRLGFASIFLVNAIVAAIKPHDFISLLSNNVVASLIGHEDVMVKIAMVNDALLGVLILVGWKRNWINAWAGTWLLLVATIKMMNLFI